MRIARDIGRDILGRIGRGHAAPGDDRRGVPARPQTERPRETLQALAAQARVARGEAIHRERRLRISAAHRARRRQARAGHLPARPENSPGGGALPNVPPRGGGQHGSEPR